MNPAVQRNAFSSIGYLILPFCLDRRTSGICGRIVTPLFGNKLTTPLLALYDYVGNSIGLSGRIYSGASVSSGVRNLDAPELQMPVPGIGRLRHRPVHWGPSDRQRLLSGCCTLYEGVVPRFHNLTSRVESDSRWCYKNTNSFVLIYSLLEIWK